MHLLFLSYFFTSTASWLFSFLMPIAILKVTNSALYVTYVYAALFMPYIIITPFSGVLSDTFNKKKIILSGEIISIISVSVMLLIGINEESLHIILFLIFITASSGALHHPAFQSLIPAVIPDDKIENFNASINGSDNAISIVAPILAGLAIAYTSIEGSFFFCLALYGISFILISHLPYTHANLHISNSNTLLMIADGFKYIFQNKILRDSCLLFICVNFGIRIVISNMFYIFKENFGIDPEKMGLFFSAMGIGAIVGSWLAPRFINKIGYGVVIIWSSLSIGVLSGICIWIDSPHWISLLWAISSIFQSFIVVSFFSLRQRVVPKNLLGRAVAVSRLLAYAAIPISAICGGYILERNYNYHYLYAISCLVIILATLTCFASPLYKK